MRSAMVRSSSSSMGSSQQLPESSLIDDIDSPVGGFEGGQLTTSISIADNGNGLHNGHQVVSRTTTSSSDPNTIYEWPERWSQIKPPSALGLKFYVQTAKIYPQQEDNVNVKKYVSYELVLRHFTLDRDTSTPLPSISRRYTDFLNLYDGLRKDYSTFVQQVIFPRKCFMGNFSAEVVDERIKAFEDLLEVILDRGELRDSDHFLRFLQDQELERACRLLDERRSEGALPILENCFVLLSKIYTDRTNAVLIVLCRLVAASSHPIPSPEANKWADLALRRFDGVCDADLLQLYVPLIKACVYLFWKTGRDKTHLDSQLEGMRKRGINVKTGPTLLQAIHALDPRTESA